MFEKFKFSEPFDHLIINDFVSKELFDEFIDEILNIDLSFDNKNLDHRSISKINKNGKIISSEGLSKDLLLKVFEEKNKYLLESLKYLAPKKVKLYDFTELRVQKADPNYDSGPHTDSSQKLLSCVVYIYPEIEDGTKMYTDKDAPVFKESKWLQNRAFIFSRIEKKTWHSWSSKNKYGRIVLVYTLMTNKRFRALIAEGHISIIKFLMQKSLNFMKNIYRRFKLKNLKL